MNWGAVRLLVTDFDGVWTDDSVYVDQDGRESVRCLRADGFGITRLQAAGVPVVVLSAEVNPVVAARCAKLKVACYQRVNDKLAALERLEREGAFVVLGNEAVRYDLAHIAYMGNDVNDLECLKAVGFPIVVRNAERAVFEAFGQFQSVGVEWAVEYAVPGVPFVPQRAGGYGAVREVCDLILEARNGTR